MKGGTVSVLGDAGVYEKNMQYTILTADKVDGTFKHVETNLAFLDPSLSYDNENAFLTLTRNGRPYTEVAQTQNQKNIAHLFDKAQQDKDKLPIMDILDSLSIAGAQRAYEQLNGSINTTVPAAGFSLFNRYMDVMKHRMQPFVTRTPSLSGADMSVLMRSRTDMGSAMGNTLMSALAAANATDRSTPPWGFFGKGYGGWEGMRRDDISSRYDNSTTRIVMGFDQLVTPSLLVGATMGHSYGRLGMESLADTASTKGYQASFYGAYKHGPAYVTGILGYGHSDHETRREVPSFATDGIAQASYAGRLASGYAEAGYKLPLRPLDIIPLVAIQGGYLRREGFTESGAGKVGLSVEAQGYASLVSSLGVRFRKGFTGDDTGATIPELKLRWDHEFSRDDYGVNASFAGRPASSFNVVPDRPDRERLITGFSVTHQGTANLSFYLAYEHTLSRSETLHTGELGMEYRW